MTPTKREDDPELVKFGRRVGIIAAAALSVVALSQMLSAQVTRDIRTSIHEESRQRVVADSLQLAVTTRIDQRLDRMASIMELVVVVVSDQADPEERGEALRALRRMRQLAP